MQKNRRLNFTSRYNLKLYKKSLSVKLFLLQKEDNIPNLLFSKSTKIPVTILKKIYVRNETIPLRLLRFFLLLNFSRLIYRGVKFLVAKKISVYNGKICKFININRGLLEVTLKCSFRFGDLIFTRARFQFKKKKKKGKK